MNTRMLRRLGSVALLAVASLWAVAVYAVVDPQDNVEHTGRHDFWHLYLNGGVELTPTSTELNTLDGITASVAELNILDNATVDYGEVNRLDDSAVGLASMWQDFPILWAVDPNLSFTFFDDFLAAGVTNVENTAIGYWDVQTDVEINDTVTMTASATGGVIEVCVGATDNDEAYLQLGAFGTESGFGMRASQGKELWFECRVLQAVTNKENTVFIGLAEEGVAAANFLTDNTGVPADKDYIGFICTNTTVSTVTKWQAMYKKEGQTAVTIQNLAAMNNATWHRFGFKFNGGTNLTFYVDGTASSNVLDTSAATFPNGDTLQPIMAIKAGEASTSGKLQVDYIKVVQER